MAEKTEEPAEMESPDLEARIAKLESENEALKDEAAKSQAASAHRGRNAGAATIAVIAALLLALAVPAVWLNRMVTNTDVYVATVAPLAQNTDIQNAVAAAASNLVIQKLDAQARIKTLLPSNLEIIAAPIAQAVNDFIAKQAVAAVRSPQFAQAWVTINRASHKALVGALTGQDTGIVGVKAGQITLDVGALVELLKSRLVARGLGFVQNIPTSALSGTIVLYQSHVLAQLTSLLNLIQKLAFWIPLLGLILAAGAIGLAADRRKAILWLGGALAVAAVLVLESLYLGQSYAVGQLYSAAAVPTPAAQAAFSIIFRDFVTAIEAMIVLGLIVWIGALVTGPSHWAVAMRGGLSGGLSGMASHLELGAFGEWVRKYKRGLRVAGAVVGLIILLLLPAPRTAISVVWIVIGYLVWLLLVSFFGAEPLEKVEEPQDEEALEEPPAGEAPSEEPQDKTDKTDKSDNDDSSDGGTR